MGPIVGAATGLVSSALGAGWPGIIALALTAVTLYAGLQFLVRWINKNVDARDLKDAASDSANTAIDIKNQAAEVRHDLDSLEQSDPPSPSAPSQ